MATWQHLRSSTANKRPTTSLADGRIAINTNTASPGLFFKDSAGTGIVKVGPVHVGTTAPNSVPAAGGSSGNYTGEQWLDTSVSPAQMKVWNGSTWVGIVADELPVSKLQDGAARQLIQTDAAGTGVEWTSDVDVPGTLDVTSTATFDSIAQHPLGTAGAPTITFTGDNNTGIYSPGADQVAISTGGSGRLFINSSGQVGIGGSPAYMLDVTTGPFNDVARFTGFNSGTLLFRNAATDLCEIRAESGDALALGAGGSERLRITSAGLVGVGTSSPSNLLEVSSASNSYIRSTTTTNSVSAIFGAYTSTVDVGSTTNHSLNFYTAGVNRATLDTSGRLGVGTTSPSSLLHLVSSGQPTITVADDAGRTLQIKSPDSSANPGFLGTTTNHDLLLQAGTTAGGLNVMRFNTAGSERVRIDSSGRVGIGTSSPGVRCEIKGSNVVEPNSISNFLTYGAFRVQTSSSADTKSFAIAGGPSGLVSLQNVNDSSTAGPLAINPFGGNVGIGTTSPGLTGSNRNAVTINSPTGQLSILEFGVNNALTGYLYSNTSQTTLNSQNTPITFDIQGERARIDSSGRLLVGTSSSVWDGQVEVARVGGSQFVGHRYGANAFPGELNFLKSRGASVGTNTIVANGDSLANINFLGADGSSYVAAAQISAAIDGTPGANDMPGRLVFSVTRDGSASPTEAVRINNLGALKASTTSAYNGATNKVHELRNDHNDWLAMFSNTNASPKGVLLSFTGASPNGTGNEYLYCDDSTALRASIRSNGGLANFQANNVNLSDRNAKKDVSPAADTWDCLKQWEIVNYRYKDQPDDADLNLGVIAQQVAESCPEVITVFQEAKDDQPEKLGVKEQQMYWMAIKALQEAQVRIEQLEAKVSVLESKP